jgi:hypothetical protein
MLAGPRGAHRPFGMQAVGQRQINRVHPRVVQQRLVAAMVALHLVGCGKGGGGGSVTAGHGHHLDGGALPHGSNELAGNVGAAQNAKAQGLGGWGGVHADHSAAGRCLAASGCKP